MNGKLVRLNDILREMGSVVIAYSGGVDSTFLCSVAHQVLGGRTLAVIASSPTYPPAEAEAAQDQARRMGIPYRAIETHELEDPPFVANTPRRCYYCKSELFGQLKQIARQEAIEWVADGSNADDLGDFRPGREAGAELGVRSPLCEAGLTKSEIRALSRERGLPTWDKPSLACLASRLPYGTEVTREVLATVAEAEDFLRQLGVRELRVRHHSPIARIEADPQGMERLLAERDRVVQKLKSLGYTYVTLDLAGFRSGSLNEVLGLGPRPRPG